MMFRCKKCNTHLPESEANGHRCVQEEQLSFWEHTSNSELQSILKQIEAAATRLKKYVRSVE